MTDDNIKPKTYNPVSCDMHSQLEVLIMHNSKAQIKWQDETGHNETLRLVDLQTQNGAEYLHARNSNNELQIIRLDTIHAYKEITI